MGQVIMAGTKVTATNKVRKKGTERCFGGRNKRIKKD